MEVGGRQLPNLSNYTVNDLLLKESASTSAAVIAAAATETDKTGEILSRAIGVAVVATAALALSRIRRRSIHAGLGTRDR